MKIAVATLVICFAVSANAFFGGKGKISVLCLSNRQNARILLVYLIAYNFLKICSEVPRAEVE